jgi:hypothetical protein
MFFACRPKSCCMCVHNTHACSSADSFAVGSGVWSVFVMSSLAYFGTQSRILFPPKRYFDFEGLTAKYFSSENFCSLQYLYFPLPKQKLPCPSKHEVQGLFSLTCHNTRCHYFPTPRSHYSFSLLPHSHVTSLGVTTSPLTCHITHCHYLPTHVSLLPNSQVTSLVVTTSPLTRHITHCYVTTFPLTRPINNCHYFPTHHKSHHSSHYTLSLLSHSNSFCRILTTK